MEMIQIIAIGVVAAVLAITIKKQSPEFALVISIAASVLIFFMIVPKLSSVIITLTSVAERVDTNVSYILIVFKIVGIAYIAEFGAQLCMDAGESAIASKIEIAGKVMIMVISAPILLSLLDLITKMLP